MVLRMLSYRGKKSYLRLYNENNQFPEEAEITAALKKLITPNAKIVFIAGDDERNITLKGDRSYELFSNARKARKSLINQGFDVATANLNNASVPAGTTILVLADPARRLSSQAAAHIQRYLAAGGDMLITAEPQHRAVINPVLDLLGVQLSAGMMVNPDKKSPPDVINARFTGKDNTYFSHMSGPYATVALPSAATLQTQRKGFAIDTLLQSSEKSFNKINPFDPSSTSVGYEPQQGDTKGSQPLMLGLTRKMGGKLQKVLISGDADFISDNLITQAYNFPFINGIFRWFSEGNFPVTVNRPAPKDDAIRASRKELSVYKMGTLWALPALLIACGTALLLIRKRK
jgi:ABC-2 type transport system permease protein